MAVWLEACHEHLPEGSLADDLQELEVARPSAEQQITSYIHVISPLVTVLILELLCGSNEQDLPFLLRSPEIKLLVLFASLNEHFYLPNCMQNPIAFSYDFSFLASYRHSVVSLQRAGSAGSPLSPTSGVCHLEIREVLIFTLHVERFLCELRDVEELLHFRPILVRIELTKILWVIYDW